MEFGITGGPRKHGAPYFVRTNFKMAALVNYGLEVSDLVSVQAGSNIMLNGGVPKHVIHRVLHYPEQRRATDWKR